MKSRRHLLRSLIAAPLLIATTALAGDFPKGSPKFHTNSEKALAKARETGKPAILIFSAAWCGPCQIMKKAVYPSEAVAKLHDEFVWAYLDTEEKDNDALAQKYGVNGIPHIQFVSSEGKIIDQQIGASGPDAFAATLKKVLKKAGGTAEATE